MVKIEYELTDIGTQELVYAILSRASKDFQGEDYLLRQDAEMFFKSDYFRLLTNDKISQDFVLEKLLNL